MYHYKLKIDIISRDLFLEREMKKIAPLKGFQHEFQTFSAGFPETLMKSQVVILDEALPMGLPGLRRSYQFQGVLVFCAAPDRLATLPQEALAAVDGLWAKPLTGALVAFYWQKLLSQIKLQKDDAFNQGCLDTMINSIPDLVWFKDVRGAHVKVNDAFCHAVGKEKRDVEGRGHYDIWDIEPAEYEKGEYVCLETEEMVLKAGRTCLFNEKVKSKNGLRQFKTYKSPIFDQEKQIVGTVGVAHDVTDLENMETEMEILLRSMPFAILVKNSQGYIINANDKFEEYFRTRKDQVIGLDYEKWKTLELKDMTETNKEGNAQAILDAQGEKRILEIHEEPILDVFNNWVGQLCICRDVTAEHALEQQILQNSNTDFLTNLYNRRYFYEYVGERRQNNPISLIYIDLDYFKKINDTYGHQVGDGALVATAQLLKQSFPEGFIARLGGDEFLVVLMGQYSIQVLCEKAEAFLEKMKKSFAKEKPLKMLSASIGIAQTSDPHMKIDTLIQQGDRALYEAKIGGRSQYRVFSPTLKN